MWAALIWNARTNFVGGVARSNHFQNSALTATGMDVLPTVTASHVRCSVTMTDEGRKVFPYALYYLLKGLSLHV